MKRKDKKMRCDRRTILTCMPSAKRKEVYTQLKENRVRTIAPLIIWAVVFSVCITLYNLFTIEDQYIYGIVIGMDMFIGMLVYAVYDSMGDLWAEPNEDEIKELGDEII